ncbi:MAG: hypothetical protein AAFO07_26760 [Bacteroidota bacterium]
MKTSNFLIVLLGLFCLWLFFSRKTESKTDDNNNETTATITEAKRGNNKTNKEDDSLSKIDFSKPAKIIALGYGTALQCGNQVVDLLPKIRHYADSVTALNLKYDQSTANDCSGTFIRMNRYLNSFCPEEPFPTFGVGRSTRDLVKYYHDIDQLILIKDPIASDTLLQAGAVMFYTYSGRGGKLNITTKNMQSLVNHVGIITEVEKDKNGVVTGYQLFHGRNPKRGINITNYHKREPFGKNMKPYPYGNGTQQWMAVAPVANNQ